MHHLLLLLHTVYCPLPPLPPPFSPSPNPCAPAVCSWPVLSPAFLDSGRAVRSRPPVVSYPLDGARLISCCLLREFNSANTSRPPKTLSFRLWFAWMRSASAAHTAYVLTIVGDRPIAPPSHSSTFISLNISFHLSTHSHTFTAPVLTGPATLV